MKRMAALISAISLLLNSGFTAFAADIVTPADLPESVYKQLVKDSSLDKNKDGVLSEEEYCNARSIYIDISGVDSIDWLCRLKQPDYISLSNGSISDLSTLKNLKTLRVLSLDDLPNVTDISFIKEMDLQSLKLRGMDQITEEQKADILKFHDADISVGYSGVIGITPMNMSDFRNFSIEIADTSIADFDRDNASHSSAVCVCGKKAGETEYVLKLDDEELYRGTIRVSETKPVVLPFKEMPSKPSVYFSAFYDTPLLLVDNTLYKLKNGSKEKIDTNVSDYSTGNCYDENGKYVRLETTLYNDGTISINGKKTADTEGIHFKLIDNNCFVSDNGDVYRIRKENNKYKFYQIYSGFGNFLDSSADCFISDKNELVLINWKKDETGSITYHTFETGIMNVTSSCDDYYVDGSNILWRIKEYDTKEPEAVKIAEDVEYIGYHRIDNTAYMKCVYIKTDGTAYNTNTSAKVTLADGESGSFKISDFLKPYTPPAETPVVKGIQTMGIQKYNYHLSFDNTMYAEYNDQKIAVADVEKTIALLEDSGKEYLYFMKTDGSVWCYSFSEQEYHNIFDKENEPKVIKGDVNTDRVFDISDVVLVQKWLLGVPNTKLADWKAADFCNDNKLDVIDLCLMKRELTKKMVTTYVEPDERFEFGIPFRVLEDELKMYAGPDESYNVITSIPAGTRLAESGVKNNNNTWLFTEYNGQCGWINTLGPFGKMVIRFDEAAKKPVIYLYPKKVTDVHVELELMESELNTTYPKYNNGWDVTAYPDGTLLNKADNTHHKYLFWDSVNCHTRFDFSNGFCVAGSDTESFLKEKLTYMGLNEQEMNEFIVYWLPLMEHNAYNLISFQGDAYTDSAKLDITPTPDSECRVFMAYVPLEKNVNIEPQQLDTFERKGFSVVEWGGVEVDSFNLNN